MDEYVLSAVFWCNKAEALVVVEKFDRTSRHGILSYVCANQTCKLQRELDRINQEKPIAGRASHSDKFNRALRGWSLDPASPMRRLRVWTNTLTRAAPYQ
jgi:hypothetical protein